MTKGNTKEIWDDAPVVIKLMMNFILIFCKLKLFRIFFFNSKTTKSKRKT